MMYSSYYEEYIMDEFVGTTFFFFCVGMRSDTLAQIFHGVIQSKG